MKQEFEKLFSVFKLSILCKCLVFNVPVKGMKFIIKLIRSLDQFSLYPFFYPFIMSKKKEKSLFDRSIKDSQYYLEFGLGGCALRALQKSKAKIFTVGSDFMWINYMRKYIFKAF